MSYGMINQKWIFFVEIITEEDFWESVENLRTSITFDGCETFTGEKKVSSIDKVTTKYRVEFATYREYNKI